MVEKTYDLGTIVNTNDYLFCFPYHKTPATRDITPPIHFLYKIKRTSALHAPDPDILSTSEEKNENEATGWNEREALLSP